LPKKRRIAMAEEIWTEERLRRKIDQAWDMAGLARMDGDHKDEARRTKEARDLTEKLKELLS
jgi:hypothetical protein